MAEIKEAVFEGIIDYDNFDLPKEKKRGRRRAYRRIMDLGNGWSLGESGNGNNRTFYIAPPVVDERGMKFAVPADNVAFEIDYSMAVQVQNNVLLVIPRDDDSIDPQSYWAQNIQSGCWVQQKS